MSSIHSVAVLGGTGKVGRVIVDALVEANFDVSIVSRVRNTVTASRAKVIQSDYTHDSLVRALTDRDAVVSAVAAGPAIAAQKTMIDAAIAAGVKIFIPSEFGSSSLNNPLEDFRKLMKPKTEIIEYLHKVASENRGFTWSCVSSGALFDIGILSGTWGFSVRDRTALIFDTGRARFDSTTLPVTAQAVVSILRNPDETANRYLPIRSFVVTPNDVLVALERVTGTNWTVTPVSADEIRQQGWDLIHAGKPQEGIPKVVQGSLFSDKTDFVAAEEQLANSLLSLPLVDLDEHVKSLLAQV